MSIPEYEELEDYLQEPPLEYFHPITPRVTYYRTLIEECDTVYRGVPLGDRLAMPSSLWESKLVQKVFHQLVSINYYQGPIEALGLGFYLVDYLFSQDFDWWTPELSQRWRNNWEELATGAPVLDGSLSDWQYAATAMLPENQQMLFRRAFSSAFDAMDYILQFRRWDKTGIEPMRWPLVLSSFSNAIKILSNVYALPFAPIYWSGLSPERAGELWTSEASVSAREFLNRWYELILCRFYPGPGHEVLTRRVSMVESPELLDMPLPSEYVAYLEREHPERYRSYVRYGHLRYAEE